MNRPGRAGLQACRPTAVIRSSSVCSIPRRRECPRARRGVHVASRARLRRSRCGRPRGKRTRPSESRPTARCSTPDRSNIRPARLLPRGRELPRTRLSSRRCRANPRSTCPRRRASGARCGAPDISSSPSADNRWRSRHSSRPTTARWRGCSSRSRISTSGTETYAAGRYLDLDRTVTGLYDLDFNRAYHPYCYYNPQYDCPYPPRENRLAIPIKAGERIEEVRSTRSVVRRCEGIAAHVARVGCTFVPRPSYR